MKTIPICPKTAKSDDKIVGANIRAHRVRLGLSQSDVGKAFGITFQQVQKYEKGSNRVGASRLAEIAVLLDVPIQSLFAGTSASDLKVPQYSSNIFAAAAILDNVRESDRDQFLKICRAVARSFPEAA